MEYTCFKQVLGGKETHTHNISDTHTHIYILHTNIANTNEYQPDKTYIKPGLVGYVEVYGRRMMSME